jgi:chitin disaccharide deacetylase
VTDDRPAVSTRISRRRFLLGGALAGLGLMGCRDVRIRHLFARMRPTPAERLGYPPDARLVIVHADDIGFAHSVNAATMAAFERGAISSGSVMVTCPSFPEFAEWARTRPRLDLGVHLTFVSERPALRWGPVLPAAQVPSLVDSSGYFPRRWSVGDPVRPAEVEAEVRAQIARAREFGVHLTHLDSHQSYLALKGPEVFDVLLRVAREERLPFRVAHPWIKRHPYLSRAHDATVILDHVIDIPPGAAGTDTWTAWYVGRLELLRSGVTEVLVHPGYDDAELQAMTSDDSPWGAAWRQADFDAVTSPAFADALRAVGAVVITWRQLGTLIAT